MKPKLTKEQKKELRKLESEEIKRRFLRACVLAGLPEPVQEFKFLPDRRFRLDYYFPSFRLACEQEGAIWTKGRHNHPTGFLKDKEKYNLLTLSGIWLLRFTPQEIKSGVAVSDILKFTLTLPFP